MSESIPGVCANCAAHPVHHHTDLFGLMVHCAHKSVLAIRANDGGWHAVGGVTPVAYRIIADVIQVATERMALLSERLIQASSILRSRCPDLFVESTPIPESDSCTPDAAADTHE